MIKTAIKLIKRRYRKIKLLLAPHPIFTVLDKIKLSRIKRDTKGKGFISIKPKGWNHSIKIRKNYIDKEVVNYVLGDQYHMPPNTYEMPDSPVILDLGSNIGLTIAHMKHIYPSAKIIGYEMNKDNFKLAKTNTKMLNNVVVHNEAVWISDSIVSYDSDSGNDAYSIMNNNSQANIKKNHQGKINLYIKYLQVQ